MSPIVRFAPSPTGHIHIGNLRTALLNWLFAKEGADGGRFILRYDDTDAARSRTEYAESILEDLVWLGLRPDEIHRQSERIAHYDAAVSLLQQKGLLYPCYETAEELDRKRKRLAARGLPPVYGRDALRLNEIERQALEAEGRQPHWRFLLPNFASDPAEPVRTDIAWNDLVRGPQSVDLASLSDPVLVRGDGSYLYTLPSVVDDGAFGITHVIRGDDHVTNTGVQIALSQALGLAVPEYGHHNLLTTLDGEGLSKRSGALSLRALRADGIEPMAVASLAALVGLSGSIEAVASLSALAERVKLSDVSSSASKFDPAEVERLNTELVHGLAYAEVAERLTAMGVPADRAEAFWLAVRANCGRVPDAAVWRDVVFGDLPPEAETATATPPEADAPLVAEAPMAAETALAANPSLAEEYRAFLATAFDLLPPEPWSHDTWKTWTMAVKTATGRKGKPLFMPLRRALTGLDHGPELADLLPLIGRERALARRP